MIAPRNDAPEVPAAGLPRARHLVATMLLHRCGREAPTAGDAVPAWKAWLFAAWFIAVALAYATHLIGMW